MKKYQVHSFKGLNSLIQSFNAKGTFWYRGQNDFTYNLSTRLASEFKDNIVAKIKFIEILSRFKTGVLKHNLVHELEEMDGIYRYQNEYYFICQAQHLGVPTIFLDWSWDWKKALYFSVFPKNKENVSGQLWIYDCPHTELDKMLDLQSENFIFKNYNPYSLEIDTRIYPAFKLNEKLNCDVKINVAEKRRHNQAGVFWINNEKEIIKSIDENENYKNDLILIEITPAFKREIINNKEENYEEIKKDLDCDLRVYSDEYIYPKMSDKMLDVVNTIREEFGFNKLNF